MCLLLAYGGYMSISVIETLLGRGCSIWTTAVTITLLFLIIIAMLKVDWDGILLFEEKDDEKKKQIDIKKIKEVFFRLETCINSLSQ